MSGTVLSLVTNHKAKEHVLGGLRVLTGHDMPSCTDWWTRRRAVESTEQRKGEGETKRKNVQTHGSILGPGPPEVHKRGRGMVRPGREKVIDEPPLTQQGKTFFFKTCQARSPSPVRAVHGEAHCDRSPVKEKRHAMYRRSLQTIWLSKMHSSVFGIT